MSKESRFNYKKKEFLLSNISPGPAHYTSGRQLPSSRKSSLMNLNKTFHIESSSKKSIDTVQTRSVTTYSFGRSTFRGKLKPLVVEKM